MLVLVVVVVVVMVVVVVLVVVVPSVMLVLLVLMLVLVAVVVPQGVAPLHRKAGALPPRRRRGASPCFPLFLVDADAPAGRCRRGAAPYILLGNGGDARSRPGLHRRCRGVPFLALLWRCFLLVVRSVPTTRSDPTTAETAPPPDRRRQCRRVVRMQVLGLDGGARPTAETAPPPDRWRQRRSVVRMQVLELDGGARSSQSTAATTAAATPQTATPRRGVLQEQLIIPRLFCSRRLCQGRRATKGCCLREARVVAGPRCGWELLRGAEYPGLLLGWAGRSRKPGVLLVIIRSPNRVVRPSSILRGVEAGRRLSGAALRWRHRRRAVSGAIVTTAFGAPAAAATAARRCPDVVARRQRRGRGRQGASTRGPPRAWTREALLPRRP